MSEEDVMEFINAYDDFTKHTKEPEKIETSRHTVIINNVEIEIPSENQLLNRYAKEAEEMNVSTEYYLQEFV